jgi:hypothetical protein
VKPGLRCTVCTHPERAAIDRAIVSGISLGNVAERYKLAKTSVFRHKAEHIRNAVERAERAQNVAVAQSGASTLETAEGCVRRALDLLTVAEVRDEHGKLTKATDIKGAVAALNSAAKHLGLQAELRGEVQRGAKMSILVDAKGTPRPEWLALEGALFAALRPYPEAADAVARALSGLGDGAPLLTAGVE